VSTPIGSLQSRQKNQRQHQRGDETESFWRKNSFHLDEVIRRAEQALLDRQKPDGSWVGEVGLNPGPTAQVVMLHAALKKQFPIELAQKAASYILRSQNPDGGWSPHEGALSDVSVSAECYTALRFLGFEHDVERLHDAARFIRGPGGGLGAANSWTQLYLSILGVLPWQAIHHTPIEILLLPKSSLFYIGNLSYWVKAVVIPMALLGEVGPGEPHAMGREIAIELGVEQKQFAPDENNLLLRILGLIGSSLRELSVLKFLRGKAIARAWQWIDQLTEANGDFGGNTCTAVNVLLALHRSGRADDPQYASGFSKGFDRLMQYAVDDGKEWRVQCCQSHVWDTAFSVRAIRMTWPRARRAGKKTAAWLMDRQICQVRGPWATKVHVEAAAWCFGDRHDLFPVTDCTAAALLALAHINPSVSVERDYIGKAVDWLLAMQDKGGGWSAYERFEKSSWFSFDKSSWLFEIVKFKDIENALFDRPKADVSSKTVEALVKHRDHPGVAEALLRARSFLLRERDELGLWRGNYGINYIYGTAFSCVALRAVDGVAKEEWAQKARDFFVRTQRFDGGWGESDASYLNAELAGRGAEDSSVVQTSWALLGLCACYAGSVSESRVISRGVSFLVQRQNANGEWSENLHQGTVFPGKVYFKYELYPVYFPLIALQRAAAALKANELWGRERLHEARSGQALLDS